MLVVCQLSKVALGLILGRLLSSLHLPVSALPPPFLSVVEAVVCLGLSDKLRRLLRRYETANTGNTYNSSQEGTAALHCSRGFTFTPPVTRRQFRYFYQLKKNMMLLSIQCFIGITPNPQDSYIKNGKKSNHQEGITQ